ncbi:MAG: hypothetical protein CSA15_08550 [Candidatus Delongbacteria bacterium]|nr:MAG: hypothetical protein CSA15_08550 [Candidatus Delongbacteria bacterium]
MNILALDIGNTKTTFFKEIDGTLIFKRNILTENLNYDTLKSYGEGCVVVVSSVVKSQTEKIASCIKLNPFFVDSSKIFFKHEYSNIRSLGADRISNISAAIDLYKKSTIVFDFGTCITSEVIDSSGTFVGGFIFPGINLLAKSMNSYTSQLPLVDTSTFENTNPNSTEFAIKNGIFNGVTGLLSKFIESMSSEYKTEFKVIATGGYAKMVKEKFLRIDEVIPNLSFIGMKRVLREWYKNVY